ncbi:TlpA family protein disulfide reductase [Flavobacteriaceae bacterium M23B6Z8]
MNIRKKSVLNLFFILLIGVFFIPPVAHESKVLLNRILAFSPDVVKAEERKAVKDFDWKLKDENWDFFNFEESKGKVIFVHFWASWRVPSIAEAKSIQKLYDEFKGRVEFYLITNEEREPVIEFMEKNEYNFPVTYLIIGEKMPFDPEEVPSTFIIDSDGFIAVEKKGVANWYSKDVRELLNSLLEN